MSTVAKFMIFFLSFPIQFATSQLLHVSSSLSCTSYNADSHKLVQKICVEVCTSTSTTYHFRDCKLCKRHFCMQSRFLFQVVTSFSYHWIDKKHDESALKGFTSHRQSSVNTLMDFQFLEKLKDS